MQETWIHFLSWEDPLEEFMATHPSILAWRMPWTEEPGRPQCTGWQRVRHNQATKHSTAQEKMPSQFPDCSAASSPPAPSLPHLLVEIRVVQLHSPPSPCKLSEPQKPRSLSPTLSAGIICLHSLVVLYSVSATEPGSWSRKWEQWYRRGLNKQTDVWHLRQHLVPPKSPPRRVPLCSSWMASLLTKGYLFSLCSFREEGSSRSPLEGDRLPTHCLPWGLGYLQTEDWYHSWLWRYRELTQAPLSGHTTVSMPYNI